MPPDKETCGCRKFTSNADILSSDRCGSVTVTAIYDAAGVTGARVSSRDMWVSWSVNTHCGCEWCYGECVSLPKFRNSDLQIVTFGLYCATWPTEGAVCVGKSVRILDGFLKERMWLTRVLKMQRWLSMTSPALRLTLESGLCLN